MIRVRLVVRVYNISKVWPINFMKWITICRLLGLGFAAFQKDMRKYSIFHNIIFFLNVIG